MLNLGVQTEIALMHRTSSRTIFSSVLVAALAFVTLALPAGASGKTAAFCKDADSIAVIPSPSLPTSDSLSAIASAVAKLPSDVTALKKIHAKLIAAVAAAPSSTLAGVFRDSASAVTKESSALTAAVNEEAAVLASPKSSPVVMVLARDLIAAFSAAAAANAYLTVDRPTITEVCRSA
jgi:hypothetical protein